MNLSSDQAWEILNAAEELCSVRTVEVAAPASGMRHLVLVRNRPLEEYEFAQTLTGLPVKVTLLSADSAWQLRPPDEARGVGDDRQRSKAPQFGEQTSRFAAARQAPR